MRKELFGLTILLIFVRIIANRRTMADIGVRTKDDICPPGYAPKCYHYRTENGIYVSKCNCYPLPPFSSGQESGDASVKRFQNEFFRRRNENIVCPDGQPPICLFATRPNREGYPLMTHCTCRKNSFISQNELLGRIFQRGNIRPIEKKIEVNDICPDGFAPKCFHYTTQNGTHESICKCYPLSFSLPQEISESMQRSQRNEYISRRNENLICPDGEPPICLFSGKIKHEGRPLVTHCTCKRRKETMRLEKRISTSKRQKNEKCPDGEIPVCNWNYNSYRLAQERSCTCMPIQFVSRMH